ncbi:MT-A70 protein [Ancylostoma duodenale]|uniref:MT-A70 protein n=1 Tax=Ancylostoma duodenale TaxID=51022 RepID=A0A0C2G978_9BILA|nr:MT-A70 protein [Ancylostoma duodenale]
MARDAARDLVERSLNFYRPGTISSAEIILLEDNSDFVIDREYCMLNSWYRNQSDSSIRLNVSLYEGEPSIAYYMPPQSTFHVGPVTDVRDFSVLNEEKFDLIVMDPPWENLSVKRQQSYVTSDSALSGIDLDCLEADGLLAIWITNRKGIDQELEVHLRRWNLKRLATFYWLKVTREGDPVCPFNGSHKLPYEKLVFASRSEAATRYASIAAADGKVSASVPMAVPSRKPPVAALLKQFGISPRRCLELFARCLQPNTVSVGFETLLLQSSFCLVPSGNVNSQNPE